MSSERKAGSWRQLDAETKAAHLSLAKLTVVAVLLTILLWYLKRPKLAIFDAFLWIEGTILLACSLRPEDPYLEKSWSVRIFGGEFSEAVRFIPWMFNIGLLLLAAAAFVGAFLSG